MKQLNSLIIEGTLRELDNDGWGHIRCNGDLFALHFKKNTSSMFNGRKARVVGSLKKGSHTSAYIEVEHLEVRELDTSSEHLMETE